MLSTKTLTNENLSCYPWFEGCCFSSCLWPLWPLGHPNLGLGKYILNFLVPFALDTVLPNSFCYDTVSIQWQFLRSAHAKLSSRFLPRIRGRFQNLDFNFEFRVTNRVELYAFLRIKILRGLIKLFIIDIEINFRIILCVYCVFKSRGKYILNFFVSLGFRYRCTPTFLVVPCRIPCRSNHNFEFKYRYKKNTRRENRIESLSLSDYFHSRLFYESTWWSLIIQTLTVPFFLFNIPLKADVLMVELEFKLSVYMMVHGLKIISGTTILLPSLAPSSILKSPSEEGVRDVNNISVPDIITVSQSKQLAQAKIFCN